MPFMKSEPEEIGIDYLTRYGQHARHPVAVKPEWNDAGSASTVGRSLSASPMNEEFRPAAPAPTREEMIKILGRCADSRALQNLLTALKNCLSVRGDDAIPDSVFERLVLLDHDRIVLSLFLSHASQLHDLCEQLPLCNSLESAVQFQHCHTWFVSLTSDLGLKKHEGIDHAIIADERTAARQVYEMLSSTEWADKILALRGQEAIKLLNLLQQGVDGVGPFAHDSDGSKLRRKQLSHFLLKLSVESERIPTSFFLKRLEVDRLQFGEGHFADVFYGIYESSAVAVKRLRRIPDISNKFYQLCREALPWRQLNHPRILPFLGVDGDAFAPAFCLVSPLMSKGNALDYLKAHSPETIELIRLAAEIADGVAYLHDEGIVHGDLRARNVLIDNDGHVQIADFGLTSFLDVDMSHFSAGTAGNPRWMAPELLQDEHPRRTYASDIYSTGRVFLELFTGVAPFASVRSDAMVILKVTTGSLPSRPNDEECHGRCMPEDIWQLISRCCEIHVENRPTAGDIRSTTALALQVQQEFPSQMIETDDVLQHLYVDDVLWSSKSKSYEIWRIQEDTPKLPHFELIRELSPGAQLAGTDFLWLSPEGRYLALRETISTAVKIYDLLKGTETYIVSRHRRLNNVLFVPNRSLVMLLHSAMCEIFDVDTGRAATSLVSGNPSASICTNDGRHFVTLNGQCLQVYCIKVQSDNSVALSNHAVRQCRLDTDVNNSSSYSIAISSDDRFVALNTDCHVHIWPTHGDDHFVTRGRRLLLSKRQIAFLPRSHELWSFEAWTFGAPYLHRWDLDSWDGSHVMQPTKTILLPTTLYCEIMTGARWLLLTDKTKEEVRFVDPRQGKGVLSVSLGDPYGIWDPISMVTGTMLALTGGLVAAKYKSGIIRIWRYTANR